MDSSVEVEMLPGVEELLLDSEQCVEALGSAGHKQSSPTGEQLVAENMSSFPAQQQDEQLQHVDSLSSLRLLDENGKLRRILSEVCLRLGLSESATLLSQDRSSPLDNDVLTSAQSEIIQAIDCLQSNAHLSQTMSNAISAPLNTTDGVQLQSLDSSSRSSEEDVGPSEKSLSPSPTKSEREWTECTDVHPPPPFDFDSPVVEHILHTWSADPNKINFFVSWTRSLKFPSHESFPLGIQVSSLSKVLLDAFVMIIVPLMRCKSIDPLVLFIREYASSEVHTPSSGVSNSAKSSTTEFGRELITSEGSCDPFVNDKSTVYDIRIKRIVDPAHARHLSHAHNVLFQDVAQPDNGHKFRVDSRDYSSLTEINSGLEEIERMEARKMSQSFSERRPSISVRRHSSNESMSGNTATMLLSENSTSPLRATVPQSAPESSPTTYSSIASWFYGSKPASEPLPSLTAESLRQAQETNSSAIADPRRLGDHSDAMSVTSETSNAEVKRDKIAARLEALRRR